MANRGGGREFSILRSVTLGGTGNTSSDCRHKILEEMMITTGSVVLRAVPTYITAVGVPARV